MNVKKCVKCGALVEVIKDCTCDDCGIKCCGEQMVDVVANSVEASIEKHKPQIRINGDVVEAVVPHVMDDDHYIEWMGIEGDGIYAKINFEPGQKAKAMFPYVKGSKIFAYCNLHGLWETEIK